MAQIIQTNWVSSPFFGYNQLVQHSNQARSAELISFLCSTAQLCCVCDKLNFHWLNFTIYVILIIISTSQRSRRRATRFRRSTGPQRWHLSARRSLVAHHRAAQSSEEVRASSAEEGRLGGLSIDDNESSLLVGVGRGGIHLWYNESCHQADQTAMDTPTFRGEGEFELSWEEILI